MNRHFLPCGCEKASLFIVSEAQSAETAIFAHPVRFNKKVSYYVLEADSSNPAADKNEHWDHYKTMKHLAPLDFTKVRRTLHGSNHVFHELQSLNKRPTLQKLKSHLIASAVVLANAVCLLAAAPSGPPSGIWFPVPQDQTRVTYQWVVDYVAHSGAKVNIEDTLRIGQLRFGVIGGDARSFDGDVHGTAASAWWDFRLENGIGSARTDTELRPGPNKLREPVSIYSSITMGGKTAISFRTGQEWQIGKGTSIKPNESRSYGSEIREYSDADPFSAPLLSSLFDIELNLDPITGILEPSVSFAPDNELFDFTFSRSESELSSDILAAFGPDNTFTGDVPIFVEITSKTGARDVFLATSDGDSKDGLEVPEGGPGKSLFLATLIGLFLFKHLSQR